MLGKKRSPEKRPLEPESFDVVVCRAALHQMIGFGKGSRVILEEIYRVLREVGFRETQAYEDASPRPASFFMKMLSAVKEQ